MCSYAAVIIITNEITVTAVNYYQLFFDGILVAYRSYIDNFQLFGKTLLPTSTRVIAIVGTRTLNFPPAPAGIIASDSSGQFWTNSSWRCSNVSVNGWMDVGFNDRGWPYAIEVSFNGKGYWESLSDISANAKWIWTNNLNSGTRFPLDMSAYCRMYIGTFDFNYILKHLSLES